MDQSLLWLLFVGAVLLIGFYSSRRQLKKGAEDIIASLSALPVTPEIDDLVMAEYPGATPDSRTVLLAQDCKEYTLYELASRIHQFRGEKLTLPHSGYIPGWHAGHSGSLFDFTREVRVGGMAYEEWCIRVVRTSQNSYRAGMIHRHGFASAGEFHEAGYTSVTTARSI